MQRFVILLHVVGRHSERPDHWDWMFEHDGKLLTWSSPPVEDFPDAIGFETRLPVTRLADHRIEYLSFEGALMDGRGSVRRLFSGSFRRDNTVASDGEQFLLQFDSSTLLIRAHFNGQAVCLSRFEV